MKMFRRQVAYFMSVNCNLFYPYLKELLQEMHMNYRSYIRAIYKGDYFGDAIMIGAIGVMFNVPITIVSPYYTEPWKVFHRVAMPAVVIVFNGTDFNANLPVTHVSGSEGIDSAWTPIGTGVVADGIHVKAGFTHGKKRGLDAFQPIEKEEILAMHHVVKNKLGDLLRDCEMLESRARDLESQFASISITVQDVERFKPRSKSSIFGGRKVTLPEGETYSVDFRIPLITSRTETSVSAVQGTDVTSNLPIVEARHEGETGFTPEEFVRNVAFTYPEAQMLSTAEATEQDMAEGDAAAAMLAEDIASNIGVEMSVESALGDVIGTTGSEGVSGQGYDVTPPFMRGAHGLPAGTYTITIPETVVTCVTSSTQVEHTISTTTSGMAESTVSTVHDVRSSVTVEGGYGESEASSGKAGSGDAKVKGSKRRKSKIPVAHAQAKATTESTTAVDAGGTSVQSKHKITTSAEVHRPDERRGGDVHEADDVARRELVTQLAHDIAVRATVGRTQPRKAGAGSSRRPTPSTSGQSSSDVTMGATPGTSTSSASRMPNVPFSGARPKMTSGGTAEMKSKRQRQHSFFCEICNSGFTRKDNLQAHMRKTHAEVKPMLKCPHCDRTYMNKKSVESHCATSHGGENPYKCPYCDLTFPYEMSRKRHIDKEHQ